MGLQLPHVEVRRVADALNISPGHARQLLSSMLQDGTSLATAARNEGIDLNGLNPNDVSSLLNDVPESLQPQFLRDAEQLPASLRDSIQQAFTPGADSARPAPDPAAPAPPTPAGNNSAPAAPSSPPGAPPPPGGTNANPGTTTSNATTPVTNPAGHAPPGLNGAAQGPGRTETSTAPVLDPGVRIVLPGHSEGRAPEGVQNNSLIQRLFGGEGVRTDATQNLNPGQARHAAGADAVRDPGAVIHARADGNTPGMPASNAGVQGREASMAPQHNALLNGRSDGGPTQAAAPQQATTAFASQQASPQGATFAGQQGAMQAQAGDRALPQPQSPLPQNLRGGESAVIAQRAPDAAPPPPTLDRSLANQRQLLQAQQQPAPAAPQARPDAMAAQVAAQLAGATVLVNPQANLLASQLNPNAMPTPPGAENAANAARDALLAPAGHTLAGFLRRDHRGGKSGLERRPADWLLAMIPGARKQRMQGEEQSTSFQWLFWVLTVVAYGSLAAAVVIMVPNRGQLLTAEGAPTLGVYALAVGGIAALVSWWLGRKLASR
jgi:hypothetical protein